MLVGYLALWNYLGSGDGSLTPPNALFASRITLYCGALPNSGCIQVQAWLWFAAFIVASILLVWPMIRQIHMSVKLTPPAISDRVTRTNATAMSPHSSSTTIV